MEASYFYLLVLPLGIFVFLLAVLTQYYARKEELARKELNKLMNAHAGNQLEKKKDGSADYYRKMKLEKALEQLNAATIWTSFSEKEEDENAEPHCSEEDCSCNPT